MRLLMALLLLIGAPALAQDTFQAVAIPDTPAGRFAATWLNAFNSADPAQLERYNALYNRRTAPQDWIDMHAMTGRLTPVRVEEEGPNALTILYAAEHGDAFWRQMVSIDPSDPMKVASAGIGPAPGRPPEFAIPRMATAELNRLMDRKVAEDAAAGRFSGTIMVQQRGRIIYQAAAGLADRSAQLPVTMDTRFRMGSANKMFTAIGILQLVEEGKVSLDAPVGTYLPDYPNADFARSVTIRQLLSHSGGAGDIFTPEYQARRLETRTHADYVRLFGQRPPDASPEGKNGYANYGFVLLGRIIEAVSGQDYYDYVHERIFVPAGMTDTGSLPEEVEVPNRSRGYMRGPNGTLVDNAGTLPWRGTAAGGGYTTAADLIRFADALRSGRLVSPAMLAQATSPQHPDGWYGFGFSVGGEADTRNWGHGGGAPGMNAAFRVFPELDAVVVALSNLDPMAADNMAEFYANRMAP